MAAEPQAAPEKPTILIPKFELFPAALLALPQWCCWSLELNKKRDRWTKVPRQANGHLAKTNDPATWGTFESVRIAYEHSRSAGGVVFAGVGFCRADPQLFVDLDGCFNQFGGWAQWDWGGPQPVEIWRRLAGQGASERSVMGHGLHSILISHAALDSIDVHVPGLDHAGVALYTGARFFAMSGESRGWAQGDLNVIDSTGLHRELALLLSEVAGVKLKPKFVAGNGAAAAAYGHGHGEADMRSDVRSGPLSDEEVLEQRQHDPKFAALWEGHWEGLGLQDDSHSGADLALMQKLFYYSGNREQTIRLFSFSGLYRGEEKPPDYLENTFTFAAGLTTRHFERKKISMSTGNGNSKRPNGHHPTERPAEGIQFDRAQPRGGQPLANLRNACLLLERHPDWKGVLAMNQFANRIIGLRDCPWGPIENWVEVDNSRLCLWMQEHGFPNMKTATAMEAAITVASNAGFHPLRSWLQGLKWDGEKRLDSWLSRYVGAEESLYTSSVGRWWLLSGVARILEPGAKADYVLVLEGPQGIGKSMGLEALAFRREWFADQVSEINPAEAGKDIQGKWIVEFSELDTRRDIQRLKSFLSRSVDHFRPSYGRISQDFPRQCIFAGTTNQTEYLQDETGNRRFWPVRCRQVLIEELRRDAEQLWAEAIERLPGCVRWPTGDEMLALVQLAQEERQVQDPWEPLIAEWCDSPTMSYDTTGHPLAPCVSTKYEVYIKDVLTHCILKTKERRNQADQNRVSAILKKLGFDRGTKGKHKDRVYTKKP